VTGKRGTTAKRMKLIALKKENLYITTERKGETGGRGKISGVRFRGEGGGRVGARVTTKKRRSKGWSSLKEMELMSRGRSQWVQRGGAGEFEGRQKTKLEHVSFWPGDGGWHGRSLETSL